MSLAWGPRVCIYNSLLTWCCSNKFIQPLFLFSSMFFQNNYQIYSHNRYKFLKRYNNTLHQPGVLQRNRTNRTNLYIYWEPRETERERERLILGYLLTQLWAPARLKSIGAGWKLRVDVAVLKQNSSSRKPVLLLRASADYMRSTHIIKGNVLYLKSTHYKY